MPRNTPDSAMSGFSICIGDQSEMDFEGDQRLTPAVKILSIRRK
jgi:hypothetical protein